MGMQGHWSRRQLSGAIWHKEVTFLSQETLTQMQKHGVTFTKDYHFDYVNIECFTVSCECYWGVMKCTIHCTSDSLGLLTASNLFEQVVWGRGTLWIRCDIQLQPAIWRFKGASSNWQLTQQRAIIRTTDKLSKQYQFQELVYEQSNEIMHHIKGMV